MTAHILPLSAQARRINRFVMLFGVLWSAAISVSAIFALNNHYHFTLETARIEGIATYNKDILYRRWAAGHGGVYVPITEETPPNPYLDVPDRDVTTTDGLELTLINPAYMTRQVHELAKETQGTNSHITSLNPIRPENAADEWETKALLAFEDGQTEISEVKLIDGEPTMRYMHALVTEGSCLACHAAQGYEVGDIRGGISVSVPLQPYLDVQEPNRQSIIWAHALLWVVGIAGIGFARHRFLVGVTREAEATDRLRESETRFRLLAENASDIIYRIRFKPEVCYEYISPAIKKISGYAPQAFYDDPYFTNSVYHPDDLHLLQQSYKRDEDVPVEMRMFRANGKMIWVERKSRSIFDEAGELIAIEGIVRDITERKRIEEELRQSEAFHRMVLEGTRAGTWEWHIPSGETNFNERWAEMVGYTLDELAPISVTTWQHLTHPDDLIKANELLEAHFAGKTDFYECENRMQHKDGHWVHVLDRGRVLVWDDDGLPLRMFGTHSDITARKRVQQREFELALEKERRQLLGQFIRSAAHEFRTPLTIIRSSTHLLARIDDSQRRQQKIVQIDDNIDRITSLVDVLQLMTTLENETGNDLRNEPVDIGKLIDAVCEAARKRCTRGHIIEASYPPGMVPVPGSAYYLQKALQELTSNACRFTPVGGEISIVAGMEGSEIWVEVRDQGPGISSEAMPHIFETFWRQDSAHTTPGLGLGLSIVQKIVEQHRGSISVHSEREGGSCFRITLKVAAQSEAAPS